MTHKRNVKAIILVGSRDFGRCPLASRLPTALWPVLDKTTVEHLLQNLSEQGIKKATICSNGDASILQDYTAKIDSMQLTLLEEPLPVGTAGCIRDAAGTDKNTLYLVLHAANIALPDIDTLIRTHQSTKSDLTVVLEPDLQNGNHRAKPSEIYICEPAIIECIPNKGYCDIKEGLIPTLVRAKRNVRATTLAKPSGNFRDRAEYLFAISNYLQNTKEAALGAPYKQMKASKNIWLSHKARLSPKARIYGPAVLMDDANVSDGAVIVGPTIVGKNVKIGPDTLVENSALWDGARIGQKCLIQNSIVDYNTILKDGSVAENQAVVGTKNNRLSLTKTASLISEKANTLLYKVELIANKINPKTPGEKSGPDIPKWLGSGSLAGIFIWSYWPQLAGLWSTWQTSDEYSCGLLVPFIALYILWSRRHKIATASFQPSIIGLFGLLLAQIMRYFGLFFMYSSAENLSLVLSIASLVLFLFGWQIFAKVSSILLFLFLMLPPPRSIHTAVTLPLQDFATTSAVFCLETMGYAAIREGNIIHLNGTSVAVTEACNGLRMVTAFFLITGLTVQLIRRAWWEKLIVLASSLPIALMCNVARLTVTAIVFAKFASQKWEVIFHDYGGYAMMPLAILIVVFELWILQKLTTGPENSKPQVITRKHSN